MDDEKKFWSSLKKSFQRRDKERNKRWPLSWIILGLLAGVLFMIIGNFNSNTNEERSPTTTTFINKEEREDVSVLAKKSDVPMTMLDYERHYASQLKEMLEQIVGVSNVSVVVNLAETETIIYEKNRNEKIQKTDETDREGGKRFVDDLTKEEQLVIIRQGDKEEPLLKKREKPTIRGVLVVAEGVDNVQVKAWVVEAVSRVLEVPTHRVSVMPKKKKED